MPGKVSFIPVDHDPWADLPKGPTELRQGPMSVKDWLPFVGEALKQYGSEKIHGAINALKLPGNVLQGKVDPNSAEGFSAAMTLAGMLPVAGMGFAEPGAAGIFGGKLAHNADMRKYAWAEHGERIGIPRRSIWEETGWWRGPDGEWRFEIPDNAATYTEHGKDFHLPARVVLDHPELFDNYVQLRSLPVRETRLPQGIKGVNYGNKIELDFMDNADAKKSVLLHELQHSVQQAENMQLGSNERMFINMEQHFPQLTQMRKLRAALIAKNTNLKTFGTYPWTRTEQEEIKKLASKASMEELRQLYSEYAKLIPQTPFDVYKRTVGEVEARAVQKRNDMATMHGENYYKTVPPWEDYDIPEALQILQGKRGLSFVGDQPWTK